MHHQAMHSPADPACWLGERYTYVPPPHRPTRLLLITPPPPCPTARFKDPHRSYLSVTHAGGTPNYMAPELFNGSRCAGL
jgi:hypothetical protein